MIFNSLIETHEELREAKLQREIIQSQRQMGFTILPSNALQETKEREIWKKHQGYELNFSNLHVTKKTD